MQNYQIIVHGIKYINELLIIYNLGKECYAFSMQKNLEPNLLIAFTNRECLLGNKCGFIYISRIMFLLIFLD